MSDLFLLTQTVLEMFYLLTQHVVHLQLLLHHSLQLLHVGIHVEVHVTYSLYFWNQLTLLCQQLSVLLDSCHVCREHFLLLFQYIRDLLLKSEIFLANVVVFESGLHDVDVLLNLLLVNLIHLGVHYLFDLLLNMILLLFIIAAILLKFLLL